MTAYMTKIIIDDHHCTTLLLFEYGSEKYISIIVGSRIACRIFTMLQCYAHEERFCRHRKRTICDASIFAVKNP